MFGPCRKCGRKEDLIGGLCENHRLERDQAIDPQFDDQKKLSKEEILKELEEKKKNRKNWWG